MKLITYKFFILLFALLAFQLINQKVFSQVPDGFSYQAVIRDADNNLVRNHDIGIRFTILQGSATGKIVYTEALYPTSDANGLVSLEIGRRPGFDTIPWANGPFFMKLEVDPAGSTHYTISGTTQLLSVPYALHAATAERMSHPVPETDPVFIMSVAAGITAADTAGWNHKPGRESQNLSEVLFFGNDANGIQLKNVADPVDPGDAATKAYVDELKQRITEMEDLMYKAGLVKVSDVDSNVYKVVKIGRQFWMGENLKAIRYNNGDLINATDTTARPGEFKHQAAYHNDENNVPVYGRLYTWYAIADSRSVCPTGWHVPGDADWDSLSSYLGGQDVAGGKMKTAGVGRWNPLNTRATNESGFSGLPGGYCSEYWDFLFQGIHGYWWSSTETDTIEASFRAVYNSDDILHGYHDNKNAALSIRCLKELP